MSENFYNPIEWKSNTLREIFNKNTYIYNEIPNRPNKIPNVIANSLKTLPRTLDSFDITPSLKRRSVLFEQPEEVRIRVWEYQGRKFMLVNEVSTKRIVEARGNPAVAELAGYENYTEVYR